MQAILISADDLKKTIPGYDPKESHKVHAESARLADAQYDAAVKTSEYDQVVLLSGGSASGKTEFMSEYLLDRPLIIVDGTLPTLDGAKIKIKKALNRGKKIKIIAVWPADLKVAFAAFLQRDRKYPDEHFYRTHSQSRETLLELAKADLDIEIEIYENHFDEEGLVFYQYTFDDKAHLIEELEDNQYTKEDIIDLITES